MAASPEFLGRGWAFPPSFGHGGADVEMVAGAEDIAQSLHILLSTRLGERVMREDFGSDLSRYQFEEVSARVISRIRDAVSAAIMRYEARIDLERVTVDQQPDNLGLLLIGITYQIRGTNSRFNMVYPFYINEANV